MDADQFVNVSGGQPWTKRGHADARSAANWACMAASSALILAMASAAALALASASSLTRFRSAASASSLALSAASAACVNGGHRTGPKHDRGAFHSQHELYYPSPPHHHCGFLSLPVSGSVSDPAQFRYYNSPLCELHCRAPTQETSTTKLVSNRDLLCSVFQRIKRRPKMISDSHLLDSAGLHDLPLLFLADFAVAFLFFQSDTSYLFRLFRQTLGVLFFY